MFRFHHTTPFRAQPPILLSTAAYGKRLFKPCIRMGYVSKGMANMENGPYYGSKGLCSGTLNTVFSESLSPPRSERTARET